MLEGTNESIELEQFEVNCEILITGLVSVRLIIVFPPTGLFFYRVSDQSPVIISGRT